MDEIPTQPVMFSAASRQRSKATANKQPPSPPPEDELGDRVLTIELENKHRDERIDAVEEDVKTIKEALFGTKEDPGICEQVRALAKYMKSIQAVAWFIFTAIIVMVLADLYAIFVSHVGMLP